MSEWAGWSRQANLADEAAGTPFLNLFFGIGIFFFIAFFAHGILMVVYPEAISKLTTTENTKLTEAVSAIAEADAELSTLGEWSKVCIRPSSFVVPGAYGYVLTVNDAEFRNVKPVWYLGSVWLDAACTKPLSNYHVIRKGTTLHVYTYGDEQRGSYSETMAGQIIEEGKINLRKELESIRVEMNREASWETASSNQ